MPPRPAAAVAVAAAAAAARDTRPLTGSAWVGAHSPQTRRLSPGERLRLLGPGRGRRRGRGGAESVPTGSRSPSNRSYSPVWKIHLPTSLACDGQLSFVSVCMPACLSCLTYLKYIEGLACGVLLLSPPPTTAGGILLFFFVDSRWGDLSARRTIHSCVRRPECRVSSLRHRRAARPV